MEALARAGGRSAERCVGLATTAAIQLVIACGRMAATIHTFCD